MSRIGKGGDQSNLALRGSFRTIYRIVPITVAVIVATLIAVGTQYRAHPDEYYHVDAFHYFEDHWWPPDFGSDEVIYSPQGWSRVYTGEIVYLVIGRLSKAVQFFCSLSLRSHCDRAVESRAISVLSICAATRLAADNRELLDRLCGQLVPAKEDRSSIFRAKFFQDTV